MARRHLIPYPSSNYRHYQANSGGDGKRLLGVLSNLVSFGSLEKTVCQRDTLYVGIWYVQFALALRCRRLDDYGLVPYKRWGEHIPHL